MLRHLCCQQLTDTHSEEVLDCFIQGGLAPVVRRWDKVVPSPGRRRVLFSAKIQHCFFLIPSFNFFISLQESWAAPNTSRDALGKPSCRFPGHAFIPPHCHPPAHLPATSTTPSGFEKPKAKWRFLLWSLLLGDSSSSTVWLAAWADPPPGAGAAPSRQLHHVRGFVSCIPSYPLVFPAPPANSS